MDQVGYGALRIRSLVTESLIVQYGLYRNCETDIINGRGVRHIYALASRVCR